METNVHTLAAQRAAGMDLSCASIGRGGGSSHHGGSGHGGHGGGLHGGGGVGGEQQGLSVRDVAVLLDASWMTVGYNGGGGRGEAAAAAAAAGAATLAAVVGTEQHA